MNNDILVKISADISDLSRKMTESSRAISGMGQQAQKTSALTVGKLALIGGAAVIAAKGFNLIKQSMSGAISRYDTLNQFPRVLETMGFDANDSKKAIDKLSDGIDGLPTTLDSVAKGAQNIALMTGDIDGAVDTTLALNNAFLASGASTADANRGLQQYVQMLSKGEVDLQSWRTLQETMPVALNKTAKAFGFTGKSAQNDLYDALKDGEITVDQFNGKIIELNEGVGGFADIAKESSGGIATSWQNMKTAVVKGVADIISAIDKALGGTGEIEKIIDKMKTAFQTAFAWIVSSIPIVAAAIETIVVAAQNIYEALKPWMPLITAIVAGIATFGAVIGVMAGVSATIAGVTKVVNALKFAWFALNYVILANPIAAVVAAIIAAAVLVYMYWEPIKEFFINLWEAIKVGGLAIWEVLKEVWATTVETFVSLWEGVSEFFTTLWEGIVTAATTVWETIKAVWQTAVDFIMGIWAPIVEFFAGIFEGIFTAVSTATSNITELLSTVWQNITTIAGAAWNIIKNVILGPILLLISLMTGDFEGFKTNLTAIWNNIKSSAGIIWKALVSTVKAIVTTFVNNVKTLWNGLKASTSAAFNAIKSLAISVWNGIKSAVSSAVKGLVSAVVGLWNGLKSSISSILNGIKSLAISVWNGIKSSVTAIVTGAKTAVISVFNGLKNTTRAIFNSIKAVITSPLKAIKLASIGKDIIQGLINGIKSKVAAVANAVKDVASKITGKIKSILGIKSPSRVLKKIGVHTGEGLEIGIASMAGKVAKASAGLASAATPDVPQVSMGYATASGVRSSLSSAINGTVDVNIRDNMLAGAIDGLRRDLTNLRVEMEGETVGRIITPHVNQKNAVDSKVGRYF